MLQRIKNKLKEKKGFTLIEMIIVIAIIAILIALIAPNLVKYLDTAKQTKVDAAAKTMYTAVNTYLAEQYTKGTTVADNTYSVTPTNTAPDSPTAMMDVVLHDYFNANEVTTSSKNYKMTCNVTIAGGVATSVTWIQDGKTGTYPQ